MVGSLTIAERIILYLSNYSKFQEDYDVPPDVSQDGIASALRISRAHAAIELKKLKESEEVSERLAHIRRGKTRRKVYFLTVKGEERAREIRDYAEREGIDIVPLLDSRRCHGKDLWESLDDRWKPIMGQASVFRRPFRRDLLPETSISLLPETMDGLVDMPHELKETIPDLLDEGDRRRYHSLAADYWLQEGDYRERLYHLLQAGRSLEAEMLLGMRGEGLLQQADQDLFDIVKDLVPTSPRYRRRVLELQARIALRTGHEEDCLAFLQQLREVDGREEAALIESQLLKGRGDFEAAYQLLCSVGDDLEEMSTQMGCERAECLIGMRDYEKAAQLLEYLYRRSTERGEVGEIEQIYYLLGINHLRKGEGADAIRYLSKGLGMAKSPDKGKWYSALAEAYEMTGMREKARELRSKISRARRPGSA